ncbi:keratin, type I cytoskeletal 9-like [Procambarus clarkii]|uniref:keratin, type I cytoskeletal 9-like n=1 Tax=Procambarus clarkii TaxID=6728 RepID=UPI003744895E
MEQRDNKEETERENKGGIKIEQSGNKDRTEKQGKIITALTDKVTIQEEQINELMKENEVWKVKCADFEVIKKKIDLYGEQLQGSLRANTELVKDLQLETSLTPHIEKVNKELEKYTEEIKETYAQVVKEKETIKEVCLEVNTRNDKQKADLRQAIKKELVTNSKLVQNTVDRKVLRDTRKLQCDEDGKLWSIRQDLSEEDREKLKMILTEAKRLNVDRNEEERNSFFYKVSGTGKLVKCPPASNTWTKGELDDKREGLIMVMRKIMEGADKDKSRLLVLRDFNFKAIDWEAYEAITEDIWTGRENGSLGSGTRENGSLGSDTRETGSLGSGTRENGNLGSGTRENGNLGSGTRENGNLGSGTRENGNLGSGTRENGNLGSGTRENDSLGSGTRENGNLGSGTRENGNLGSGTRENGNLGSGTRENGNLGSGTRENGNLGSSIRRDGNSCNVLFQSDWQV